MAPPKAELYTFMNCPNHQYPATMMLRIKTILLVLELVNEVEFSFINFKSMGEYSFVSILYTPSIQTLINEYTFLI
jgi:hypothetical protein